MKPLQATTDLHIAGSGEQTLEQLAARIASLEVDRDRFLGALRGAAEMCLSNPMVVAMLPKKMKEDLRAYLAQQI